MCSIQVLAVVIDCIKFAVFRSFNFGKRQVCRDTFGISLGTADPNDNHRIPLFPTRQQFYLSKRDSKIIGKGCLSSQYMCFTLNCIDKSKVRLVNSKIKTLSQRKNDFVNKSRSYILYNRVFRRIKQIVLWKFDRYFRTDHHQSNSRTVIGLITCSRMCTILPVAFVSAVYVAGANQHRQYIRTKSLSTRDSTQHENEKITQIQARKFEEKLENTPQTLSKFRNKN